MPRPEQSRPASLPYPSRGSVPEGHSCWSHAGPLYPASHKHPTCFMASHGVEYVRPTLDARCFSGQHVPRSLQLLGQRVRWQATPSYPGKHWHWPVLRSQRPLFEHSAHGCKLFALTTDPIQAKSFGHVRCEQSGPVHSGSPSRPA